MLIHRSVLIFKTALAQIVRQPQPPHLVIQMGDLVDGTNQTLEQARADLECAAALFDQSGLRWTWIPGNHDVAVCNGCGLLRLLRRPRPYGELVLGDNVLLLLNSGCERMHGRVDAEQQEWLEQAIESHAHRRIFVFIHHVLDWSPDYDLYVEDGKALRARLLGARAVKAVFMAHAHTVRITTTEGLHEIAAGALNSWPLMFRQIEITPDRLRIQSEKVAVPSDIEAEALAAHRAHPKPWDDRIRKGDLSAELRLR